MRRTPYHWAYIYTARLWLHPLLPILLQASKPGGIELSRIPLYHTVMVRYCRLLHNWKSAFWVLAEDFSFCTSFPTAEKQKAVASLRCPPWPSVDSEPIPTPLHYTQTTQHSSGNTHRETVSVSVSSEPFLARSALSREEVRRKIQGALRRLRLLRSLDALSRRLRNLPLTGDVGRLSRQNNKICCITKMVDDKNSGWQEQRKAALTCKSKFDTQLSSLASQSNSCAKQRQKPAVAMVSKCLTVTIKQRWKQDGVTNYR